MRSLGLFVSIIAVSLFIFGGGTGLLFHISTAAFGEAMNDPLGPAEHLAWSLFWVLPAGFGAALFSLGRDLWTVEEGGACLQG